jgi:hypothetical protein
MGTLNATGDLTMSSEPEHDFWTEHGVHSPPLVDEVPLLREVAHAAWHMLDQAGEFAGDDGLMVVSRADWRRLSGALDAAGWSPDAEANARSTGARMTSEPREISP